jgi:hypothetical protein
MYPFQIKLLLYGILFNQFIKFVLRNVLTIFIHTIKDLHLKVNAILNILCPLSNHIVCVQKYQLQTI